VPRSGIWSRHPPSPSRPHPRRCVRRGFMDERDCVHECVRGCMRLCVSASKAVR
jgi:hypothetical protein